MQKGKSGLFSLFDFYSPLPANRMRGMQQRRLFSLLLRDRHDLRVGQEVQEGELPSPPFHYLPVIREGVMSEAGAERAPAQ